MIRVQTISKLALLSLVLLFPLLVSAGSITTSTSNNKAGDSIDVTVEGLSGDRDWVGIYQKGAASTPANVLRWVWIDGSSVSLDGLYLEGEYEARLFFHSSYSIQASVGFTVAAGNSTIVTSKSDYGPDESIDVTASGLSGIRDWVGIYRKGEPSSFSNIVAWKWAYNGELSFNGSYDSGEYEARLFFHNSYHVVASTDFDIAGSSSDCDTPWYTAGLTYYTSYPDPGSEECIKYNGCKWAGYFYGLDEQMPIEWVMNNNIVAVHLKDWDWLGNHKLRIRQGSREIMATVYDACSDADTPNNNCTANMGKNNHLLDLEEFTMQRFGSHSGDVEFQICD